MPTLAELQEEANAIRSESRIWDDPELCSELRSASRHAGRILGHYERSISTLQRANGTPEDERAMTGSRFDMMEIADLPRFSDAAPYFPGEASRSAPLRNAAG